MNFKKIKFNRSGMSLDVTFYENIEVDGVSIVNEISKKCSMIVHQDFIDALAGLKVHFALLCDLREVSNFPKRYDVNNFDHEEYLDKITVTGISFGGDDGEGVVIIGQKELPSGVLNVITPFTRLEGGEYEWTEQLREAIGIIESEAEQYLFEQKFGVKQLELPFDDEFSDEEPFGKFEDIPEAAEPVEKKKKGGRKKKVSKEVLEQAS